MGRYNAEKENSSPATEGTEREVTIPAGAVVMFCEPAEGVRPEDVRMAAEGEIAEKRLAELFALARNEAFWVADDCYDFEEGTPEYEEACRIESAWFAVADELENRIFAILREEGIVVPESGWHSVMVPFMRRNGFMDGTGWWVTPEQGGYTVVQDPEDASKDAEGRGNWSTHLLETQRPMTEAMFGKLERLMDGMEENETIEVYFRNWIDRDPIDSVTIFRTGECFELILEYDMSEFEAFEGRPLYLGM